MKIALIYNRDSLKVINLLGLRNHEKYRVEAIKRITEALKSGGHQVKAFEGDKDLIHNLEGFMPAVVKGERPGMAFNLAYGIQGQARYTQVPSILEMVGIPYVGSGPLAHSLSLDKVVAKVLFQQKGIPTPDFVVLDRPGFDAPDIEYPLIVKPKSEADSFGLKVVHNEQELREATEVLFKQFEQPVLVERYIDGREINVGVIGNPPEAFDPVELNFGDGPRIYSNDDKGGRSGRTVDYMCPADIGEELTARAKEMAINAFSALGCYDCARVDIRLDKDGNLHILELNSLPSLGYRGSYVVGAKHGGLEFPQLVNRLVDIASARYFGTPKPPMVEPKSAQTKDLVFQHITSRRDRIERRIRDWTKLRSRTSDPTGIQLVVDELQRRFGELGLRIHEEFTNQSSVWTWETPKGFDGGTLLIGNVDIPLETDDPPRAFSRDPEWLYGEGIGSSRAAIAMVESALWAIRSTKRLKKTPLGILMYADEGRDCRYSREFIQKAALKAKRVLVLRPATIDHKVITQRRGRRKFTLRVEGKPRRPGSVPKTPGVFQWTAAKLLELENLSSRKQFLSVSVADMRTRTYPQLMPHAIEATLLLTYLDETLADETEEKIREILGKGSIRWEFNRVSTRPAMRDRKLNRRLLAEFSEIAKQWDIPMGDESSVWPSAAGIVPPQVPVLCGVGPESDKLYTPEERVRRTSIIQRTLLLAEFLSRDPVNQG